MIHHNVTVASEMMLPVNGIEVCAETFGERTDPAVLLIGGAACSMDWWADEFCRRLAAGGRYVIRYDHRDTGRSTSFPVGDPGYSAVDMAHDALGVLDALHVHQAHLVGQSLGGMLAQRIALSRPHRVRALTLISTSRGPAGAVSARSDPPPEEAPEQPDWTDRRATVDHVVESVRSIGGAFTAEEPQLRRIAERVFDRTVDMAASQTNHFIADPGPPYRDRLGEITAPTVVLHGTQDPFFTPAGAEALTAAIPGARLIWLEGVGHEYAPEALWPIVLKTILSAGRAG